MTADAPNVPASSGAREALVEQLAEAMFGVPVTNRDRASAGLALPVVAAQVEAAVSAVRAETWADVCATLNDRADMWEADGSKRLAQESRDLANAYRTYAEGVGVPSMQTLREKRDEARTERDRVKRGAKELGRTLHRTLTDALDASGRHDVIDADGDGDWALVWETLAELRPRAEAAEAEVERLTDINRELVDTHNTYLKMVVRLEERAESAETDLRALREGLEAVERKVESTALRLWSGPSANLTAASAVSGILTDLRALLAPSPAEGVGEADDCGACSACVPNYPLMRVCATCGNMRCPHAADHRHDCTDSNEPGQPGSAYAAPAPVSSGEAGEAWVDRHGDVWREGDDGLMHSFETAPFPREHVEKKWGPLRPARSVTTSAQAGE